MARNSELPVITTMKEHGKVFYFVDGLGPNGPHVQARGDTVRFINPYDDTERSMSYVGSAVKLMVEATTI